MFRSIDEIKWCNAAHGYHFFERSTMRGFRSRVGSQVYAGKYFITSEQFEGLDGYQEPRKYTVREATEAGQINTIGEFQQFDTWAEARQFIKQLEEKNERE